MPKRVASGATAAIIAMSRTTCGGREPGPSNVSPAIRCIVGLGAAVYNPPMISLGLDARVLVSLGLALLLPELLLRAQEQKYRERQVLDPNTETWADRAPPEPAQPSDDLIGQARSFLATGKPGRARPLLQRWLKQPPDEERTYEARFLLGETYFESRDFWKALKEYQTVAENTSGELFDLANQRSVDVARAFLSGQKRIVWGFLRLPAYAEGVEHSRQSLGAGPPARGSGSWR